MVEHLNLRLVYPVFFLFVFFFFFFFWGGGEGEGGYSHILKLYIG